MITALPLGFYVPGTSIIHRTPALAKFLFLFVFILLTAIFVRSAAVAGGLVLLCVVLYTLGRIPWTLALQQLCCALPVLGLLGAFQWWQLGWQPALRIVLVIVASLAVANLLTLTTRMEDMMDALERALQPAARRGFPVNSTVLALSLTLRLLPLMLSTVTEVLDARKARGASFSILAFGTPVMIRSIRRARCLGDALRARGAGD